MEIAMMALGEKPSAHPESEQIPYSSRRVSLQSELQAARFIVWPVGRPSSS